MLQVITGRFFREVPLVETLRRGIYFSNYRMFRDDEVNTSVGRLLPSWAMSGMATFTYEIMEKLEAVNMDGSRSMPRPVTSRRRNDLSIGWWGSTGRYSKP